MDTATAKLKFIRIAPRKMRFVADMIRGLPVREAEAQLMFSPRRPSEHLLKLLRSAMANAKGKEMNVESLVVDTIMVDEGPKLKRWMPRARGATSEIQKKMSHVTLVLAPGEKSQPEYRIPEKPKKKKEEKKKKEDGAEKPKVKAESEKKKEGTRGLNKVFRRKSV